LNGIRDVVIVTSEVVHQGEFRRYGPGAPRACFSFGRSSQY
jgi:hypothetical protein